MRAVAVLAMVWALALAARAEEAPQTRVIGEKELVDDDGYVVRLSLPTEEDVAAWSQPGLRIGLGLSYARMLGRPPAVDLSAYGFHLRALARLDAMWAVGVEFAYAAARSTPLVGLAYEGTVHAVAYPWKQLALDAGLGFGGLVLSPPRGRPANPSKGSSVSDITLGPGDTLGSCDGTGWVGLARAEYQFVAGPLFASGPYVELDAQYTRCQQQLGRQDKETGNPISAVQYWLHRSAGIGWWLTWR